MRVSKIFSCNVPLGSCHATCVYERIQRLGRKECPHWVPKDERIERGTLPAASYPPKRLTYVLLMFLESLWDGVHWIELRVRPSSSRNTKNALDVPWQSRAWQTCCADGQPGCQTQKRLNSDRIAIHAVGRLPHTIRRERVGKSCILPEVRNYVCELREPSEGRRSTAGSFEDSRRKHVPPSPVLAVLTHCSQKACGIRILMTAAVFSHPIGRPCMLKSRFRLSTACRFKSRAVLPMIPDLICTHFSL